MNVESLKSQQSDVAKRGQELINEQLRLEGEHRALGRLIDSLEPTSVPVTVAPTTTEEPAEEAADGETTQTD